MTRATSTYQLMLERKEITWLDYVRIIQSKIKFSDQNEANRFFMWMGFKDDRGAVVDASVWYRCFLIAESLQKDADHLTIITGMERMGKSTLALHMASIISPTFTLKNICYEPQDFINLLDNTPEPYDSVILDEGALFLFSRNSKEATNKGIVQLFTILGQFNLNYIVCIPNYFFVDTYIRDHRVGTLIQVTNRGACIIYNKRVIKYINSVGLRTKSIPSYDKLDAGTYSFGGYRKDLVPINDVTWETYKQQKLTASKRFMKKLKELYGSAAATVTNTQDMKKQNNIDMVEDT